MITEAGSTRELKRIEYYESFDLSIDCNKGAVQLFWQCRYFCVNLLSKKFSSFGSSSEFHDHA